MSFTAASTVLLVAALTAVLASVVLWSVGKHHKLAVALLLAGVLALRLFNASLDPYLNLWDERFHAVVARNMMVHPLVPTLYEDPVILPDAGLNWDQSHVWLHKPPLFLWQIAAVFRLLGASEFAVRLPSALLAALFAFWVYRIGAIVLNPRAGFLGAFFAGTWFFLGELVAGAQPTDHNDVAFIAYVTGSLWAWTEYSVARRGKTAWAVTVGLLAGAAILTKWLVGLSVFAAWALTLLPWRKTRGPSQLKHLALAVGIAIVVFAPWQIYTNLAFPGEAAHELALNKQHLMRQIEGHGGDIWFHLANLPALYGKLSPLALLLGIFFLCRHGKQPVTRGLIFCAVAIYGFFSVAKTKMMAFPLPACSVVFLCLAAFAQEAIAFVRRHISAETGRRCVEVSLLVVLGYLNLNLAGIAQQHSNNDPSNWTRQAMIRNKEAFTELGQHLPPGTVLFNIKGRHAIEAMFYSHFTAYDFLPTDEQIGTVTAAGRTVAIFANGQQLTGLNKRPGVRILTEPTEDP